MKTDALSEALYVDTSALLRMVLEGGTSPSLEARLASASCLVTSRLSLVEAARALLRVRALGQASEAKIAVAEQEIDDFFSRCEIWELTPAICLAASSVAPTKPLRSLDALHVATFFTARKQIGGLVLLSADERLLAAAGVG